MDGAAFWIAGLSEWAACALFAAGAATDLGNRTVPNAIPLTLLALFAIHAATGSSGASGPLWAHFAVGAALLAGGFALYTTGRFGGGDAKLVAAAGLWTGPGGLALFLLALGACALSLSLAVLLPFERARRMRSDLPFAVAIAPAALAVMIPRALGHQMHQAFP